MEWNSEDEGLKCWLPIYSSCIQEDGGERGERKGKLGLLCKNRKECFKKEKLIIKGNVKAKYGPKNKEILDQR